MPMRYEYGHPADFLFRYQRAVEATTAAEFAEAAQTYPARKSRYFWW